MTEFLEAQLTAALAALADVPTDAASYSSLADSTLLEVTRLSGRLRQVVGTHAALGAGELARRSTPELGHAGLAATAGYRTPEELLCLLIHEHDVTRSIDDDHRIRRSLQDLRIGQLGVLR